MNKSLLLLFLLLARLYSFGQVPGYQGSRLSLGYNASTFAFYQTGKDFPFGMKVSYKSEFSLEYATSRKTEIGVSYYYAKQKFEFPYYYQDNTVLHPPHYVTADDFVPCKMNILLFHIKFFVKNLIAPIGIYHEISLGVIKYKLGTPGNLLLVKMSDAPYSQKEIPGRPYPYSATMICYHIGKTNPISHRFYINTSVGMNFMLGGDFSWIGQEFVTSENYILANMNKEMRKHNFADIKIGFGFLAY